MTKGEPLDDGLNLKTPRNYATFSTFPQAPIFSKLFIYIIFSSKMGVWMRRRL